MELEFFWEDKSSTDHIHLGIKDGCQINLEADWEGLSKDQKHSFSSERDPPSQEFLYYRSCWMTELLMKEKGQISINLGVRQVMFYLEAITRKQKKHILRSN